MSRRTWRADPAAGLTRADRRACAYGAYVPDPLVGRPLALTGSAAAEIADAEAAITRFMGSGATLASTEGLARLLLRAESVASSHIEGLDSGGQEVLANVDAMAWAVDALATAERITVEGLREIHRRLLSGTRLAEQAGVVRTSQNWIGGSSHNPCSAAFVPPPPEHVPPLLEDLCAFCNGDELSPVAQAGLAHAQFETIHPFADGNGRAGRALIHVVLRRRGLTGRALVPVSLVLATWSRSYVEGLTATRYVGPADGFDAKQGTESWLTLFAGACRRAVADATAFQARIDSIREEWRASLGALRAGSAAALLLDALPATPLVTIESAAQAIGRSFQATNEAMNRLVAADVVRQVTVGRRNRAFEARAVLDAFNALERQLASPDGDTHAALPARPVPGRRDGE